MSGARLAAALLGVGMALAPTSANALPSHPQQVPDSILQQIRVLQARVDSLTALVARLQAQGQPEAAADAGARLRAAAAAAAAAVGGGGDAEQDTAQEVVGRQRSLQGLNPEISVTGDLLAISRQDARGEDAFVPREFEFSFISSLDPFSRAKIFVAHHTEGGVLSPFAEGAEGEEEAGAHGHGPTAETEIEEGYVEWVSLPGGLGLTMGKFRQQIGTYNRWHAHAIPWQQLPLPYVTFLGEEGLAQTGASVHWLLPVGGIGTYDLWFEATRSSSDPLFGASTHPSWLGRVNAFFDLSSSSYVEVSASGLMGDFEEGEEEYTNRLLHLEGAFNWRPPAQALYREFGVRGAVMWRSPDAPEAETAMGAFVGAEMKLAQQWLAGARYDYVEDPDDPTASAWMIAPTLTWWQSEYVRLRAEYNYISGDVDPFNQFLLQVTFSLGPHKH